MREQGYKGQKSPRLALDTEAERCTGGKPRLRVERERYSEVGDGNLIDEGVSAVDEVLNGPMI